MPHARILVVEDFAGLREHVCRKLDRAGSFDALRIEAAGNELLANDGLPPTDVLCAYPLPRFAGDPAFKRVCLEHGEASVRQSG